MTDRQNFETNAINHGVKVLVSEPTKLVILATNGIMVTTYTFDENGKFTGISHTMWEIPKK